MISASQWLHIVSNLGLALYIIYLCRDVRRELRAMETKLAHAARDARLREMGLRLDDEL